MSYGEGVSKLETVVITKRTLNDFFCLLKKLETSRIWGYKKYQICIIYNIYIYIYIYIYKIYLYYIWVFQ